MTLLELRPTDDPTVPPFKHVGYTGPRVGMTLAQQHKVIELVYQGGFKIAHHGDCIGGDAQFHTLVKNAGLWIVGHPPLNAKYRAWCEVDDLRSEKDYGVRDADIVQESDLMIATPKNLKPIPHSGTWLTIRIARQQGKELIIVWPSGSISHENAS